MPKARGRATENGGIGAWTARYLHSLGSDHCFTFKIHADDYTGPGIPDRIAVIDGIAVFMEFKKEGETPDPVQLAVIEQIKDAGGIAGVCYTPEDVLALVQLAIRRASLIKEGQRHDIMTKEIQRLRSGGML